MKAEGCTMGIFKFLVQILMVILNVRDSGGNCTQKSVQFVKILYGLQDTNSKKPTVEPLGTS